MARVKFNFTAAWRTDGYAPPFQSVDGCEYDVPGECPQNVADDAVGFGRAQWVKEDSKPKKHKSKKGRKPPIADKEKAEKV